MAKEIVKVDDHTIEERETKVISQKYDFNTLKMRRDALANQLAQLDALIAQAESMGVVVR